MRKILTLSVVLISSISSFGQAWSGIIDPARAIDWTGTGVTGGIPVRNTICQTLNPGVTAAQIQTAVTSCAGTGGVVFLNAGTYNLSAGLNFTGLSNFTLRGAGADQTFLVFSNDTGCRGFAATICLAASSSNPVMPSPSSTGNWTAGYPVGTTAITVSSTTGMQVGSLLILDQDQDATDDGTIWNNYTINVCCSENGNAAGRTGKAQAQMVRVTNIAGSTITVTPAIRMPNWRSGQNPGLSWSSAAVHGVGLENLSIDHTNAQNQYGVVILYAYDCWVKGIRSLDSNRNHVVFYQTMNSTLRDSYIYDTQNHASQSYGVELFLTTDILIENNIFQKIAGPWTIDGQDTGSVFGFNYAVNDRYTPSANFLIPMGINHEVGQSYELAEGNIGPALEGDIIHGTHHFVTYFRNYMWGDPAKTSNTAIMHLWAFNRYFNIIGNVLGRTGYYNTYQTNLGSSNTGIYGFGEAGSATPPSDANVLPYSMRWGNYDTVNAANRFVSAEVPSGVSPYGNAVPGNNNLPNSFYLSSKPSWFGTITWPPIGPDVTDQTVNGNNGSNVWTAQTVNGHVAQIPALNCYENVMGGGADGTGGPYTFNPDNCYASIPNSPSLNFQGQVIVKGTVILK